MHTLDDWYYNVCSDGIYIGCDELEFKITTGNYKKSTMYFPASVEDALKPNPTLIPVITLNFGSMAITNVNNEQFTLWEKAEQFLLPFEFGLDLWQFLYGRMARAPLLL